MAWPWVFALNLGTRLTGLFDDEVGGVTLDHGFNARFLVPWKYDEASEVRRDPSYSVGVSSIFSTQSSSAHSQ
jgi:hypothetical protein